MTTVEFLATLHAANIRVWAEGGNLCCRGPRGALTPALREQLADRKREILLLLQDNDLSKRSAAVAPRRVERDGALPLSFAQERLWFLHQMAPDSAAYNIVSSVRFTEAVDTAALQRALDELVCRHETLRTTFVSRDGQPELRIAAAAPVPLPFVDLRSAQDADHEAAAVRTQHAEEPFDLESGPLMRAVLVRLRDAEWDLLLSLHHIISDRWSLGVLLGELQALYRAFAAGNPSPLAPLPLQYVDFAAWQREQMQDDVVEGQLAYWREQLGGTIPVLNLPTDRPRPATQTHRGAWESRSLAEPVAAGVKAIAPRAGVTPFMVFLAAFDALFHRYTGQQDILVGSPIAGRTDPALEGLVGCFVNMLVLRTNLSGNPSFTDLLGRVREVALGAYDHADVPFEKLVADLQPRRDPSRSPFFQVALMYQSAPRAAELTGDVHATSSGGSLFDLTLFVTEIQGRFVLTAEYNVNLFDRATVGRLLEHYETLLRAALENPDKPIAGLPVMAASEETRLLREWNETATPVDPHLRVPDLVARHAAQHPETVAVACGNDSYTYGELEGRANQLARHLRSLGVGPDTIVGVCVERSLDMIVALLGILKAGGAYVPLDPSYPIDRLAFMIADAAAPVLVTQEALLAELPSGPYAAVCLDRDWPVIARESAAGVVVPGAPDSLAYVIYTSGSTGRPKGVQISHRALTNLLAATGAQPGLDAADVMVSVTTLSFDISGLELFLPLIRGAAVVIATRDEATDGGELMARLESSRVTVMQATPATWRLLIEAGWAGGLAKMLCGGEAMPRDLAEQLLARGGDLWNMYGPTETTIWSTCDRVTSETITIGRPIANTQLYILDARLQPLPVGVPGELYIAGDGLARGYRGRPDLTAERFVPNPFGAAGGRMYWTGDVARYLPDGRVECLGRVDHQVKVRGFRIELSEIEAALTAHDLVKEAVVYAEEASAGDNRLVAYVVHQPGESLTASELRQFIRTVLPEYMVPSFFVKLDRLPLTPNGKVDRRALPNAFNGGVSESARTPPVTATERRIADIWQRALGVSSVGVEDNFFDIGGHSLLSMRVIAEINRTIGQRLSPRAMFMENLKQIAEWCDRQASGESAVAAGLGVRQSAAYGLSG